ncbi:MAG: HD domain-containing protein [Nitrospirota bacterium]
MGNSLSDVTGRNSKIRPDPVALIEKFYPPGTKSHEYITLHGRMVADKALAIAEKVDWLPPEKIFIEEAALLHDIGIFMCDAPHLGCAGNYPYIAHGYLGRQLLEDEGYPLHALVCERHVGCGLRLAEIRAAGLPVPEREMMPITPEEEIICFADKFFPVTPEKMLTEQGLEDAREMVAAYGERALRTFDRWAAKFGY